MPEFAAWAIFFLPLASFVIIALIIRPFFNRYSKVAGYTTVLTISGSLVLSLWALKSTTGHEGAIGWQPHSWMTIGNLDINLGILMDSLTAIMLVVVTAISLMVQIYSQGYMRGDKGYARYFAFMSLFTASMIGLVLARNMIQLFVFWELVGLCSYLLIGFWYHRPSAVAAAKKAFIVTRLGDFGLLLAILYLFFNVDSFASHGLNPLEIPDIYHAVVLGGVIGSGTITWLAIGVFAGAVGKSAQFPLHTWLPDAMEGPTPVSALIHSATMVTAGVFLVARLFPIFVASDIAMNTVAIIGGVTAIFAASMALVMNDIKRVMAYSTISQLGYMMLALGVGAYGAAIFHLFTHAFFKALLFLGSGSVNHASGTFNMQFMGGLRRYMPWTYVTFMIAGISLAGIFPLAGFWSKDEILAQAWAGDFAATTGVAQLVFWLALIAVFMTAFYIFRVIFLTFHSEFKGGIEAEEGTNQGSSRVHLAESSAVMVMPMILLGIASIVIGFIANPPINLGVIPIHWISEFVPSGILKVLPTKLADHFLHPEFNVGIAVVSNMVALAGVGLAYVMYQSKQLSPEAMGRRLNRAYTILSRKYYFDEAYEDYITTRVFYRAFAGALDWADRAIVDKVVNNIGWFGRNTGRVVVRAQTGQLQLYAMGIPIGILVIFGIYLIWG